MSNNNGVISKPVSIYDIQQVLGESSSDLGTLCRSNSVNMWAKFKPVRWSEIDTTDALNSSGTGWNTAAGNKWWKSMDNNYGLNFTGAAVDISATNSGVQNALNTLATRINGGLNGWVYQKPSGSQVIIGDPVEPYRALDFLKYNHQAPQPIQKASTHDVYARNNAASEYTVAVEYLESADVNIDERDYVKPDDIIGNVTLYRGLAIFSKSGSTYTAVAWCTGKEWQGGGIFDNQQYTPGDNYVETHLKKWVNSDDYYYVLPVYFTCPMLQNGVNTSKQITNSGYKVITVPHTSMMRFKAIQSTRYIALSNKNIAQNYSFDTDIYVKNLGSGATIGYDAAIVNELFTGMIGGAFPSGTYAGTPVLNQSITIPSSTSSETTTYATTLSVASGTTGFDNTHTWSVYVNLNGTEYYIALRQPAQQ